MPTCPECGNPATIQQPDAPRCVGHATSKTALYVRLRELESARLPADPAERHGALAEADAIERRLGELDGHAP